MNKATEYRYPGSRPFQDTPLDQRLFFGRTYEAEKFLHTILAEGLVVLFAKSGIGKTSFLNAGVMPILHKRGFLPLVIRLNEPAVQPQKVIYDGLQYATGQDGGGYDEHTPLQEYFKSFTFTIRDAWSSELMTLTPLLVFDPFEEFFFLYPSDTRKVFLTQIAEVVKSRNLNVKLIISIREDFLGQLEEMAREIPGIFRNRFRLTALTRDQARTAIVEPAGVTDETFITAPFQYTPEAVEAILDFLCKQRIQKDLMPTEEVEPFQLQLLCQHLENLIRTYPEKTEIQQKDLGGEEGMHRVLEDFYDAQIHTIPSKQEQNLVRKLCEQGFITAHKRRRTLEQEDIESRFGVSQAVLHQLVNCRLLRSETRRGIVYYELSHDTLIEPIKKSQAKRDAQERERQEAEARQREMQVLRNAEAKRRNRLWLVVGGLAILALVFSFFMYPKYKEFKQYQRGVDVYNQGNESYAQQDYRQAKKFFEEALALNPTIVDAYQKLGIIYNEEGRYGDAVTQLLNVIELKNADAVTYRELGDNYLAVGEYAKAAESYKHAIALSPQDPELLRKLGDVFLQAGDGAKAAETYVQALELTYRQALELTISTFDYVSTYRGLGDVFFKQGRYDDAIAQYQKVLILKPDDVDSLTRLGDAFFIQAKYPEAKEQYQKLSGVDRYQLNPKIPVNTKFPHPINTKIRIALIALVTNELEKAISVAQEMVEEEFVLTEPEHALITRFVLISAYLLLDNQTETANALSSFLEYYKALAADYQKTWRWDGINLFISQSENLIESQRALLRTLIEIIASPLSENTSRITDIERVLSQIG